MGVNPEDALKTWGNMTAMVQETNVDAVVNRYRYLGNVELARKRESVRNVGKVQNAASLAIAFTNTNSWPIMKGIRENEMPEDLKYCYGVDEYLYKAQIDSAYKKAWDERALLAKEADIVDKFVVKYVKDELEKVGVEKSDIADFDDIRWFLIKSETWDYTVKTAEELEAQVRGS